MCTKLFSITNQKLKGSWKTENLELEDVMIPTGISTSLSEFLFAVSRHSSGSLLSVDTIQEMPMYNLFEADTGLHDAEVSGTGSQRLADQGVVSVLKQVGASPTLC